MVGNKFEQFVDGIARALSKIGGGNLVVETLGETRLNLEFR